MDYNTYHFSIREKGKFVFAAIGIMAIISYLFYENGYFIFFTPLCIFALQKAAKPRFIQRRKQILMQQFQDTMQVVRNSLLSGYSIESAWLEAEKEILSLYGQDADMWKELHIMNQSIKCNIPIEQLLEEFSQRTAMEDIVNFSEVFSFAKRNGGDLVSIIGETLYHMQAKLDIEREIAVLVASKKFEQNIMSVMPIFILAYLKLTSGSYLDVLYGNAFGMIFMTVCLVVYVMAMLLADKILRIQV